MGNFCFLLLLFTKYALFFFRKMSELCFEFLSSIILFIRTQSSLNVVHNRYQSVETTSRSINWFWSCCTQNFLNTGSRIRRRSRRPMPTGERELTSLRFANACCIINVKFAAMLNSPRLARTLLYWIPRSFQRRDA